ncbi:unnamed protein product [Closterium sp. NIES-64]|nr:unnamed protein product [Closterium sp. NIES-64]
MATPSVLAFNAEGRAIDFDVWVDDLQLSLQCDRADGLSLFDLTSGASPAPAADADATVRSQWATRDAAARLAMRRRLPTSERAHFSQPGHPISGPATLPAAPPPHLRPRRLTQRPRHRTQRPRHPTCGPAPSLSAPSPAAAPPATRAARAVPTGRAADRRAALQQHNRAARQQSSRAAQQPSRLAAESPSRRAAQQPSRPAAEPPSSRAAQVQSRRAAEPPSSRAAEPPSRPAAEPLSRRAALHQGRPTCPVYVFAFDAEGRAIDFEVWVDDLQLFLQCDRADGLSLFDLTSGASPAPAANADATVCSQWATRDAAARLAVRRHLPTSERAHFSQYKSAQTLYDAVVTRYSSPATAALSRLMLPYLFPDLAAFPTVADLITHLRTSDSRYRAALPADFCAKNPPPMYITLYYIVTRLPDSLRVVRDHFLSVCPTTLTVDLLEKALLAIEKSIVAVGASRGDPRTPIFEGCSPSPLLPSVCLCCYGRPPWS